MLNTLHEQLERSVHAGDTFTAADVLGRGAGLIKQT